MDYIQYNVCEKGPYWLLYPATLKSVGYYVIPSI